MLVLSKIANELWGNFCFCTKNKKEENMHNMLDNFNDKKEINNLFLMTYEPVTNPNSSDNDDDGQ